MGSNPTLSATEKTARAAVFSLGLLLAPAAVTTAHAQRPLSPEIEAFIGEVADKHQFETGRLRRLFAQVQVRPAILRAIAAPITARPWHEFRSRYVDAARINGGAAFWRENAAVLARASREFGVPEEIIVATIGVETLYGRNTGSHRVLDALVTLAFHYPPRAELFRSELEQYLLLARETGLSAAGVRGSYAGAIGIPQFLPSSYRRYAIDFDGDGRRDLISATADAIGSVANYYRAHGWREGEPIAVPAEADGGMEALLELGLKPQLKIAELRRRGVTPGIALDDGAEAALIAVETEYGLRHWLGLNNFYVITRYNRSANYALAVHELARELRALVRP